MGFLNVNVFIQSRKNKHIDERFDIPSKIGLKLNCLKCGSSVAPRKPIEALVAAMLIAHTIIPGIFNKLNIEAENFFTLKLICYS